MKMDDVCRPYEWQQRVERTEIGQARPPTGSDLVQADAGVSLEGPPQQGRAGASDVELVAIAIDPGNNVEDVLSRPLGERLTRDEKSSPGIQDSKGILGAPRT
jgi:hypothetical protein